MSVHQIDINLDGQQVKSHFYECNGVMMISALFFKHANVLVDYEREQQTIILKQNNTTITFFKDQYEVLVQNDSLIKNETLSVAPLNLDGKIFIPFQYVVQNLRMSILEYSPPHKINLMTNHSARPLRAVFYKGSANKKMAALTFDDGPDEIYTPQILDILEEKKVKATFFVVGQQVRWQPEVFKRILREGHEIGNHSWSHPNFIELSTSELKNEIKSTETEIRSHTGKSTTLLRPPYGFITNSDIQIINELGYKIIMWSVDTLDWSGLTNEEIMSIVNRDLTEGAIILQHSFKSAPGRLDGSVKALPEIIDKLIREGYEIVTIPMLLD
ncbi:polysaccharide deacetylase family protein [Rummeliibacillus pycnus]|uniref:polysaccharide deacetylase family protein n=1 Tax=Rummeliibacillus pycnus TaxID=101070 RepID=UPI003D2B50E0